MPAIPESVIEEIRSRNDIVDVIGSYLDLKRAGGDSYKALCPFHNEKTPSFNVRGDRQLYHCFGCGKGGNVFRFIMERENISFVEAAHLLASRCGVIIPENSGNTDPAYSRQQANTRERLYSLNEEFAVFFAKNLQKHPDWPAAHYLLKRNLPEEWVKQFRLGAAPDEWDGCLRYGRALGFTDEEMLTGGIVRKHEASGRLYDHFKGRLLFPIWNEIGKVVGFSARSLEDNPSAAKYVNTAETPVFKKGRLLYALPFARKRMSETKSAILCEGQLDTIAFHRAGFEQAVAPQGTGFTTEQARMLRRSVDQVMLAFDSDRAGQKAIRSAIEILLPLDLEVKIIRIPAGKDPDALFAASGAEGVASAVDSSVSWVEHLAEELGREFDLTSPGGCSRAVAELVQLLLLLENPVGIELYVRQAAELLRVSPESIEGEISRQRRNLQRRQVGGGQSPKEQPEQKLPTGLNAPAEAALLTLFELAVHRESAARRLAAELPPEYLGDEPVSQALNIITALAMNGEFDQARSQIGDLLAERPEPRLSALLMSDCTYTPRQEKKAIGDCLETLNLCHSKRTAQAISEQLRQTADPEDRFRLLRQLMESAAKKD